MPDPTVKDVLTSDHHELYDTLTARRYFAKFDTITGHLGRVAAEVEAVLRQRLLVAEEMDREASSECNAFRCPSERDENETTPNTFGRAHRIFVDRLRWW